MKEIYSYISGKNSVFSRAKASDHIHGHVMLCERPDECELYKCGKCLMENSSGRCRYGHTTNSLGPSRRAIKYDFDDFERDFIKAHEQSYRCKLDGVRTIAHIIDTIYIPIHHLSINKDINFVLNGGFGLFQDFPIISKADFTPNWIADEILEFHPRSLFGGVEIEDYQKKELPSFMRMLKSFDKSLFDAVIALKTEYKEKYENISNVGRKAYLRSLSPNVGIYKDCHGADWIWDGEYLTSNNSAASFMLIDRFQTIRIKPLPDSNPVVAITDDDQVNEKTQFED